MSDHSQLEALREQMGKIIKDNPAPPNSPTNRAIALFEDDLRESGIQIEASIAFSELGSHLIEFCFNSEHGFYGRDYQLSWEKQKSVWSLFVLNTKSTGKRRLLDCPEGMKVKILDTLETFASKMAEQLKAADFE